MNARLREGSPIFRWIQSIRLRGGWRLPMAAGIVMLPLLFAIWFSNLGRTLVCEEQLGPRDAILVENFDPNYLVFERAAELKSAGMASKVFVPVNSASNATQPNIVSLGIVEVMARVAHLRDFEIIPITITEPISLNAAYQIRTVLLNARVRSVVVVAPGFRSRRSSNIYAAVFGPAGISTSCVPVFGPHTPQNWTRTWHGIQDVAEQYLKLQYYRFFVLPGVTPGRTKLDRQATQASRDAPSSRAMHL
jgi:hypothetical protein